MTDFQTLLTAWTRATAHIAAPREIATHETSIALCNAPDGISHIIDELKRGPSTLVFVLQNHLKLRPYEAEIRPGDLTALSQSWIRWNDAGRPGLKPV